MPRYHYHVIADPEADMPPPETLPSVAAASPGEAVTTLDEQGRLPIAGDGLYLRLECDDGAYLLPLTPDYELPLDWQPED
jgi:hypothetical protein